MIRFEEYTNKVDGAKLLSEYLVKGELVLFLGSGVSQPFGLPGWVDLINRMTEDYSKKTGVKGLSALNKKTTTIDLQGRADLIRSGLKSEDEFFILVRNCLYAKVNTNTSLFEFHTLIAIASLMMGGERGRVTKVVTLNYDSMLEWFLSMFGYSSNSVFSIPYLEGSKDVTIYHPHGYLPFVDYDDNMSDFLILGLESIESRFGNPGDRWLEFFRSILRSSFCLFIGLSNDSLSDPAVGPLFRVIGNETKNQGRFMGIWLGSRVNDKKNEFKEKNIVPISIEINEIPHFLQSVCRISISKKKTYSSKIK